MIRPVTCVCFLLACGSGLYLYQAKHRVNLLDEQIRQTVRSTEATREQIRLLHAEWTRLSQPDRLQKLADQFLNLRTTSPSQFTSMAELDGRLPPVPAPQTESPPPPAQGPLSPAQIPVGSAAPADESLPAPAPAPPLAAPTLPTSLAVAGVPPAHHDAIERPVAESRPIQRAALAVGSGTSAPHPAGQVARPRAPVIETADRPAWQPPRSPAMPVVATQRPSIPVSSGSLLGMAHAAIGPPAPLPVFSPVGPNGN